MKCFLLKCAKSTLMRIECGEVGGGMYGCIKFILYN